MHLSVSALTKFIGDTNTWSSDGSGVVIETLAVVEVDEEVDVCTSGISGKSCLLFGKIMPRVTEIDKTRKKPKTKIGRKLRLIIVSD